MKRDGDPDFVKAMLVDAAALPARWWLLVFAVAAGTNALDFFAIAGSGGKAGPSFIVAAALRVSLVFWVNYALLRRLAGVERPMRPGLPFLRFALFLLLGIAATGGATLLGTHWAGGDPRTLSAMAASWTLSTALAVLFVRLQAWLAALAAGDRSLGLRGAWTALAGLHGRLALAVLLASLVSALHSALTRLALTPDTGTGALGALAVLDGAVSAAQLVLGSTLAVRAWRVARERAGPLRGALAFA